MPCPAHPDVDVDDCVVCELYWHIIKVHGPADPQEADAGSLFQLMLVCGSGNPRVSYAVPAMISWMQSRGVRLHRTLNGAGSGTAPRERMSDGAALCWTCHRHSACCGCPGMSP